MSGDERSRAAREWRGQWQGGGAGIAGLIAGKARSYGATVLFKAAAALSSLWPP